MHNTDEKADDDSVGTGVGNIRSNDINNRNDQDIEQ